MPGQGGFAPPLGSCGASPPRDIFEQKMVVFQMVNLVLDREVWDVRPMGQQLEGE